MDLEQLCTISAGWSHSAAVDLEGQVWVWGDNIHGQSGADTSISRKDRDYRLPFQFASIPSLIVDYALFILQKSLVLADWHFRAISRLCKSRVG